jgi:hypothetical protein
MGRSAWRLSSASKVGIEMMSGRTDVSVDALADIRRLGVNPGDGKTKIASPTASEELRLFRSRLGTEAFRSNCY